MKKNRFLSWLKENWLTVAVLCICTALFAVMYSYANSQFEETVALSKQNSYRVYEKATVLKILSDDSEQREEFENKYVGSQSLQVKITSGEYKNQTMTANNYIGALYGSRLKVGDSIIVIIDIEQKEVNNVIVYEYNRSIPILILIFLFFLITIWVGGKKGAQSLIGLVITILSLVFILIPLLMIGFPTLLTVFLVCAYVALFSFTLLGGVTKKTVCAMFGTIFGIGLSIVFGLLAQEIFRVDGMRMGDYVDALLQLKKAGMKIQLSGLLIAGMMISALGAVMDVAMSISSALKELTTVNPNLTRKDIWKSGMNIGRDMIGTMTNTLILAFVGSSFLMVIYLWSLELPFYELINSSLIATEIIHGLASSMGIILSVPFTVLVGTCIFYQKK
ncbi:YibE/F family protein [Velocimicrobium porci]|uniref:YibE/F family protein n=1 Tax=Velocimicrobium porci TaxID=2606634 RepID=A0A6L5XXA8_9FIRM|nr:YibE/F family protein [Velocimicrobium porci]MSS63500.1 YibE/F family protein [Velocimicrobium porci]